MKFKIYLLDLFLHVQSQTKSISNKKKKKPGSTTGSSLINTSSVSASGQDKSTNMFPGRGCSQVTAKTFFLLCHIYLIYLCRVLLKWTLALLNIAIV